jgi:hypothetical protein
LRKVADEADEHYTPEKGKKAVEEHDKAEAWKRIRKGE